MSNNAVNYEKLLSQYLSILHIDKTLFNIMINYIKDKKKVRVRKLFDGIQDTEDINKRIALADAIKKKLMEPDEEEGFRYISEIKKAIKNEELKIDEYALVKWATKIQNDPETTAIEMINEIIGIYKKIDVCKKGVINKVEPKVEVKSTFRRGTTFDFESFMAKCSKKDGYVGILIHDVLKYYPTLELEEVFGITFFEKMIEYNCLIKKAKRSSVIYDKNILTRDEIKRLKELAQDLTSTYLLEYTRLDYPELRDLYTELELDKVMDKFAGLVEEYGKRDFEIASWTLINPELVVSEVNNHILHELDSMTIEPESERFEFATQLFDGADKIRALEAIKTNRQMMKKFDAKIFNDSLDDSLSNDEAIALLSSIIDTQNNIVNNVIKKVS